MRAAVVHEFRPAAGPARTARPTPRPGTGPRPRSRRPACATPTSTPPTATGRSSRRRRSSRATRASASSRAVGAGRHRRRGRRPRRGPVARLGLRRVRVLRVRLGDAVPEPAQHRLLGGRRLRRVRRRRRRVRRPVPDGIDPLDAAPLTCAGVTTYKAVKVSGARPSDLVAVFGIGGLGHLALQYAQIAGGTVVAVDVVETSSSWPRSSAPPTPSTRRQRIRPRRSRRSAAPTPPSSWPPTPRRCEQAFRSLRRGGRLVLVGLPADNVMRLPIFQTVLKGITVIGSIVGTRVDLAEVFELHAAGRTRSSASSAGSRTSTRPSPEVEQGDVDARIVFDLR